ncbi:MAG: hypothetical protein DRG11_05850 [Epsilonproteobacteria bacterium]|nr:MAG: hypothetical protein DRG11_05850 [Campylobacterota bacterium]
MIVAIVPFTKNFIDLLYFLGLFSIFNIILFKLKNKSSKYISKNDYVPLYELKEKAIFYNHNVLYQNYLYHKDIKEKKMFTSKISFVNIILIVLNYFFVQNGSVNIFIQYLYINLNYDIFIISIMLVIVLMLTLFIHANKYIQPSGYSVHKNELLIKAGNDKLPENNMLPAKFSNQNIVNE